MDLAEFFRIMPGAVAAMHPTQHGVRAGLQWKVRMAREAAGVCGIEREQLGCPVHWFNGAETEPGQRRFFKNRNDEIDEALLRLQIAPPPAKVDAREH